MDLQDSPRGGPRDSLPVSTDVAPTTPRSSPGYSGISPCTSPRAASLATWMSECDDWASASAASSPIDEIPRSSSPVEGELSTSDGDEFDNGGGDGSRAGTAASEIGRVGSAGGSSKSSAVIDGEGEGKRQTLNTSSWKRSVVINAPHILLETINARTAGIIIVATYLCFIVSFIIDFNTTYTSFNGNNNDFRLGSRLCSATNASLQVSTSPWGCWSDVKTWHGTVDNLSNVLLVTLAVRRDNFSLADAINSTADPFLFFNVDLYACFLENGCGSHFVPTKYTPALKVWQKVLSTSGYSQSVLTTSDMQLALSQQPLEGTFFSIFQNQESLPTNGLVKSYYVQVSFLYEQTALISATSSTSTSSMSSKPPTSSASLSLPPQPTVFVMSIASRPPSLGYNVATILLFIATVFVLATYILMMRRKAWSEWLQEQKWLVVYLVCIILYQNPIYIIVNFHATAVGAFLAYFISDLAQACLLVVWLLFADSVHLQEMSPLRFYAPKVLAGLAIFLANLIVLSFQFPSFSPESGRNPVESVYNWRSGDKLLFIGASMCFLVLFWLWALVWFATIYLSQQKLDSLSYMSTRYLQLSFRFFFMQATLVTVYYILQYAATIYFISVSQPFKQNVTTLTDNINVLFRQQTQLFGKTLFLTVYGAILAFLFLPADILGYDMAASLAATYAVSIKEQELLVRKRKRTIRKQSVLMNQVVSVKPHIFCVDLALSLLEVAFEAYNDSDGKQRHGYLVRERAVAANLQPFGYSLVEIVEDKTLDILLLVARHTESKRLVFAFRGTRSTKNMGNNLDYAQKDVDIGALSIPDVANTSYLSGVVGAVVAPASPDLEDAESDDSSNQDTAEEKEKNASAVDCGSANIFEMAFRFLASALQAATTNALHVGGEFVLTAASVTPGLNQFIRTSVHSGFWKAYIAMRGDVHRIVFKECKLSPGHLIFTGHSLGCVLLTV